MFALNIEKCMAAKEIDHKHRYPLKVIDDFSSSVL